MTTLIFTNPGTRHWSAPADLLDIDESERAYTTVIAQLPAPTLAEVEYLLLDLRVPVNPAEGL